MRPTINALRAARCSAIFLLAGLSLGSAAGCGATSASDDMATAGPDLRFVIPYQDLGPENFPDGGAPTATTAVVTTSSFMTFGAINTVALADRKLTPMIDTTIGQDHMVRAENGRVYVADHTAGTVRIYNPAAGFKDPIEIKTGTQDVPAARSNPHDVLPLPASSKIYVSLYGNDAAHAVGVIDPSRPADGVIKWIPIPASPLSPLPRAEALWGCGGLVYVTLQDLDANFGVTGPGRVAVIDPSKDDAVIAEFALVGWNPGGSNPGAIARRGEGCDLVLIANTGDLNPMSPTFKQHANLERVDLTRRRSDGVVADFAKLGGAPGGVTSVSATLAYVTINLLPDYTQKVVALNPQTGVILGDATELASFIGFSKVSPDGKLYVGVSSRFDMKLSAVGLYIGAADGKKITGPPIDLGQAPYGLAFY